MFLRPRTVALAVVALTALACFGRVAPASAYVPPDPTHHFFPNVNDPAIDAGRGENFVWLGSASHRVGRLLVFMPSGGPTNIPQDWREMGNVAMGLGYHVIVLAYQNEAPIAANPPAGCGNSVEPPASPPNCAINARMEMLDGNGESTVVTVSRANSIQNRLTKALQYLAATYPDEGWAGFLDTSGAEPVPRWDQMVAGGASLGGAQAVLISMLHTVYRVSVFHGWTDAKHGWVHVGLTPSNRYFTLIHQRDNFFARTCFAYVALGLATTCPLLGFTLVENQQPPFGTPQLVFNLEPSFNPIVVADPFHSSTTRDGWIAREADGNPNHFLVNAWRAVLGDSDSDTFLDEVDNCDLVANPEQTDTDADGTGDACDATPEGTTPPTIVVPGHITVDATGPAGATVTYAVTATDDIDANPTVLCAPVSGSVFAIGDTTVECSSTDHGGNTGHADFLVTVKGADAQLADLRAAVEGVGPGQSLAHKIENAQAALASNDVAGACSILGAFVHEVQAQSGKKIPVATAASLVADAERIQAVLAC